MSDELQYALDSIDEVHKWVHRAGYADYDQSTREKCVQESARFLESVKGHIERAFQDELRMSADVDSLRTALATAEQTARVNVDMADSWRRFTLALGGHPSSVNPEQQAKQLISLRAALAEAVEALEGCWARLKTDRELVEKHATLGKVYDGLVEDAEAALAAAQKAMKP